MEFIITIDRDKQENIVVFKPHNVRGTPLLSICKIFQKLGGKPGDNLSIWFFPHFINEEIIKQVIHNTCFKCGGLMADGEAIKNQDLIHKSIFSNTIWQNSGQPELLVVRKCTVCGHSHT